MAEPIKFFFDEHVWGSLAAALKAHGIDVLTAQDAGRCGLSDPEQLAFASGEDRVMMTFDSDYVALHNSGEQHAGIAFCHEHKHSKGGLLNALLLLHGVLTTDEMRNQVEYL